MTLRGVLFDFTDTLAEVEEEVGVVYARIAAEFDFEVEAERLSEAFARVMRDTPRRHFPSAPSEQVAELERGWWHDVAQRAYRDAQPEARFQNFDACFDVLFEFYASRDAWRLRPGARRLLRQLRTAGLRSGLVSNFDHRLLYLVEALEISELLDTIQIPGRCRAAKPDSLIFRAAAHDLGLPIEDLVYLGHDPVRDIAGADAAGLRVLDGRRIPTLDELAQGLEEAGALQA